MYLGIVTLSVCCALLAIGLGKKALKELRLSANKAILIILIVVIGGLFPIYTIGNVGFNIEGIILILMAVFYIFRSPLRQNLFNLIGLCVIVALLGTYTYFTDMNDLMGYGEIIYAFLCIFAVYLFSVGTRGSVINGVLSVAIISLLLPLMPSRDTDRYVIGGASNIMVFAVVGSVLMRESISKIGSMITASKRAEFEFAEDNETDDDVKKADKEG